MASIPPSPEDNISKFGVELGLNKREIEEFKEKMNNPIYSPPSVPGQLNPSSWASVLRV